MFVVYEVLLYLVFVLGMPFFLAAGLARGKYLVNVRERLGYYRSERKAHDLWIHAVSVGETLAARTVVASIERLRPGTSIVFTTTTITGQQQARELFPTATVTYFPFDFSQSVRRFLGQFAPRVFATMETEIWPNVTRLARARGMRLILANGRISDRSYPRYRAVRRIIGGLLGRYDRILAREELDRERFIGIGAPPSIVETSGNVKFDFEPDATSLAVSNELEALIGGRKVIMFGSTIEGEDEACVRNVVSLIRNHNVFVIVAPRRPERFEPVARLYVEAGIRVTRRSAFPVTGPADLLVLDTLGELSRVYRYATAAFVGGSLLAHGGHNPIEPAAFGVPVCFGPHMSNFREIASMFLREGGAEEVVDGAQLEEFMNRMISNEGERQSRGERGRTAVLRNRGASERTARRIVELLG